MNRFLLTALTCILVVGRLSAQMVDTTVCDVLSNPQSFDGKMVRIKATVAAGFEEFIVKGTGCRQPVNALWLAYPEGTKAKAGPAAFVQLQLGRNNPVVVATPNRTGVKLEKNKEFKQFDLFLSTPYKGGGMCLGCIRYTVTATLIGRLDGTSSPGVVRDGKGNFVGLNGFGNLSRYSARLVLQAVADVAAQEIDYAKNGGAAAKDDSQPESATGDPVAAAHQAARAFGPGSPAAEQVERAAAAFGKEGEDNGVEVGFGVSNEVPKDDDAKSSNASPDGLLFNCTFDMDRLKGDALSKAISHVGTHIADIRGSQSVAPEANFYDLEYHAWQTTVLSAVSTQRKTLTLPGGYLVWSASWLADERSKTIDQAISRFLSDWASLSTH